MEPIKCDCKERGEGICTCLSYLCEHNKLIETNPELYKELDEKEEFKIVAGFPGYECSVYGVVRNIDTKKPIKCRINRSGYASITLKKR